MASLLCLRASSRGVCARQISSISAVLNEAATVLPKKDALRIVDQDIRWSFGDLKKHTDAMATGLLEIGYKRGHSLVVCLPATAENLVTQLAAAQIGLSVTTLDVDASEEAISEALKASNARAIFMEPKGPAFHPVEVVPSIVCPGEDLGDRASDLLESSEFPHLRHMFHTGHKMYPGLFSFRHLLVYGPGSTSVDAASAAVTDADSLSAGMTHGDVVERARRVCDSFGLTADDKVCLSGASSEELAVGAVACLMSKSQLVVPSARLDGEQAAAAIAQEQCTALYGEKGGLDAAAALASVQVAKCYH